jgi:uncharacterized membrane protein
MFLTRCLLGAVVAFGLAYHGYLKNSLSISGAISAFFVGFIALASSYRCGIILIVFYYSGSKFTKLKEKEKAKLEHNYAVCGQRTASQVLANSLLGTAVAVLLLVYCEEDGNISFAHYRFLPTKYIVVLKYIVVPRFNFSAYLWSLYVAHYATATADTWASEVGILSTTKPRLITSFFTKQVPPGTNGAMSLLGTVASAAGGCCIGLLFWLMSFTNPDQDIDQKQYPMVVFASICGLLGSIFDSLLGATLQATYYDTERKCIVRTKSEIIQAFEKDVITVSGMDILSNEAVNFVSIAMTMILSIWLAPNVFCLMDADQCDQAEEVNRWVARVLGVGDHNYAKSFRYFSIILSLRLC